MSPGYAAKSQWDYRCRAPLISGAYSAHGNRWFFPTVGRRKTGFLPSAIKIPSRNSKLNFTTSLAIIMHSNRTSFAIAVLMIAASVGAMVAQPSAKVSDERSAIKLERVIPRQFGEWQEAPLGQVQVVNPQTQELLDKLYSEIMTRIYVNPGRRLFAAMGAREEPLTYWFIRQLLQAVSPAERKFLSALGAPA